MAGITKNGKNALFSLWSLNQEIQINQDLLTNNKKTRTRNTQSGPNNILLAIIIIIVIIIM